MPSLTEARWELFAQGVAKGLSGRQAYQEAGYSAKPAAADVAACRLLSKAKIVARVTELKERAAFSVQVTKAWCLEQAIGIMKEARDAGQSAAAIRCVELIGREVNAFIEKKEIGEPGAFANLSDDELARTFNDLSREIRACRPNGSGDQPTPEQESLH